MLNAIGLIVVVLFVLFVFAIIAIVSSVKFGSKNGSDLSLLWGAIEIKGKNIKILGDKIVVDGESKTVKVGGIVDVDGKTNVVNVSNGDILVDGKDGLIRVKKDIVVEINEDKIFVDSTKLNTKIVSKFAKFKKGSDPKRLKIEGRYNGEDDLYIFLKSDNAKGDIDIQVGF